MGLGDDRAGRGGGGTGRFAGDAASLGGRSGAGLGLTSGADADGRLAFAMVLGIVIKALGPYPGDWPPKSAAANMGDFFSNGSGPLSISSSTVFMTRFGDESDGSRVRGFVELTRRSRSFVRICFSSFCC